MVRWQNSVNQWLPGEHR